MIALLLALAGAAGLLASRKPETGKAPETAPSRNEAEGAKRAAQAASRASSRAAKPAQKAAAAAATEVIATMVKALQKGPFEMRVAADELEARGYAAQAQDLRMVATTAMGFDLSLDTAADWLGETDVIDQEDIEQTRGVVDDAIELGETGVEVVETIAALNPTVSAGEAPRAWVEIPVEETPEGQSRERAALLAQLADINALETQAVEMFRQLSTEPRHRGWLVTADRVIPGEWVDRSG